MATTGQELGKILENKIDKSYSGFLNPTRQNRLFKEALFTAIENKDKVLDSQKVYDELKLNLTTNQVFNLNNNQIYTSNLSVTGAVAVGFVVTITTLLPHNFVVGDNVSVSAIAGLTNVNGTFSVTQIPTTTTFSFVASALPAGAYTANTGLVTSSKIITDYMHLKSVKAKFTKQYYDLTVIGATNATPIVLTLSDRNNLRSGEQMVVSGVLGNTAANGTYYIKQISSKKVALYSDKDLQTGVAGNGTYTSGGVLSRMYYEYCTYYHSDRKINIYNTPTIENPKVELSKNLLRFYPTDETCQEITIDYLNTATVLPDVTNTVIDLETYYPYKFLVHVCVVAENIFAKQVRDEELTQSSQISLEVNK